MATSPLRVTIDAAPAAEYTQPSHSPAPTRERRAAMLAIAATLAACVIILVCVLQLWRANWAVPFAYDKDALLCGMLAKSVAENGWYLHNPLLGAPSGLAYYDYPFSDMVNFALLRVIALFTGQYAVIINVFFVLSFPLAAITALYALRHLRLTWPCACVGALLYTFLPFHFMRGEAHLFLSMYWVVPLAVLVMAWLGEKNIPRARVFTSAAVCVLLGLNGYYYAYFAAVLFVLAGAEGAIRCRSAKPLILAIGLSAVIATTCVLTALPNLSYWHAHGRNSQVAQREPREADYYGLKIAQLLLPVTGHRLAAQAALKDSYNDSMLLINENDDSTLGTLGSLGFLVLLAALIARGAGLFPALLERMTVWNIGAVLLGTMGGFGSLAAVLFLPQIRSYNRVSIYIAFFALYAVLCFVDLWCRQSAGRPRARALCFAALVSMLLFGLFDQTSASFVPDYARVQREWASDSVFVRRIETSVPPRSAIFQLPAVSFPESPPVARMTDYQLLRGYLHSSTLRWSYGAMRGRDIAPWRVAAARGDVRAIASAGFRGIWIDGDGYADGGAGMVRQLSLSLHAAPIIDSTHRLFFFPVTETPHEL